ncbi:hypothetical protein AYJ02_12165 [Shewanella algae]|nr:hypothetical protein AYJ02_12165 [Shewanella algae]
MTYALVVGCAPMSWFKILEGNLSLHHLELMLKKLNSFVLEYLRLTIINGIEPLKSLVQFLKHTNHIQLTKSSVKKGLQEEP